MTVPGHPSGDRMLLGGHTLHRGLVVVLAALTVLLTIPVTPVRAASDAKVVVIVGPVGDHTAHYTSDANAIVTEARKYTANVVKVYTPNATWSRVKAAAQGANVLVYLGHGNGWPSRYPPFQTNTKDGLGLDPSVGADSTKVVYYGEEWIRSSIRLAPNAAVLMFHLCYASGNTEPGLPVGTFSDSRLRVDNYGAGFIGAGARAVFAEGHPEHPVTSYIRQLFTTSRSMDRIFRAAPTFHNHVVGPYPSQRTPGLQFEMDPDTTTPSGFYRSLVGDLAMPATAVTGPTLASTGVTPPDFVVPGAAEVTAAAGAGLFSTAAGAADPAGTASSTLPDGTRLRVSAEAEPAADGTRIVAVTVLGASASGFLRATDIAPRDSQPTVAWNADVSNGMLSPNGDGMYDELVVTTRFSEVIGSSFKVQNAAGTTVKSLSMTDDIARYAWDLLDGNGKPMPDGTYTWTLKGRDTWGNSGVTRTGTFVVDSTPPVTTGTSTATAGANGWLVSPASITLAAKDGLSGVAYIVWRVDGGTSTRYGTSPVVFDTNGSHTFEYRAVDKAGLREDWHAIPLKIDTKGPSVALPLTGKAGDAAGTWRGDVTITPALSDATSGVVAASVAVDGGAPATLGSSLVVKGDGDHSVRATARDAAGNTRSATTTFRIDTTAPVIELPPAVAGAPDAPPVVPTVTPNGDGATEQVSLPYAVSEPAKVTAVVTDAAGTAVRTLTAPAVDASGTIAWDGRTAAGAAVPDGRYTVTLTPRDLAGNTGDPIAEPVDVYAALSALKRTPSLFFPQDGDALARTTTATFTLLSPATVSVRVTDGAGTTVRTGMTDAALPAGPASWAWDGKLDDGTWAPRGGYRIVVSATNGTQASALATSVRADAFKITTSVATAVRGKALKVTAVTAEPLAASPKLMIREPGVTGWSVTMTRTGTTTWVATITPKTSGTAGTLTLGVRATDTKGGTNSSTLKLPLQ